MRRVLLLLVGVLAVAGIAVASSGGATHAQARWVITDLGTLGGATSEPLAINERGQVVGWADTKTMGKDGEPIFRAFLWQNGKMRDLGARPGLPRSTAMALNDHGQVVLIAQAVVPHDNPPIRAYVWQSGRTLDLPIPRGGKSSVGLAMNERGQVIGCADHELGHYPYLYCWGERAYLWSGGTRTDLGTLGGRGTEALAINDKGQVVGRGDLRGTNKLGDPLQHAFLWRAGKLRDLGTLGGKESEALAINERGEVVGSAQTKTINRADDYDDHGSPMQRAFLWANGRMRDLGTFGGPDGEAIAINQRGQVVGWVDTKNTSSADRHMGEVCGDGKYSHPAPHAFLWANGRITDLGSLGGLESEAAAVNDKGQVVGWADTKRSDSERCAVVHAFVWENGRMTDLGTLPGGIESEAVAINNRGQIIGWSVAKNGSRHAVLWTLKR